jgi:hypothetical protein
LQQSYSSPKLQQRSYSSKEATAAKLQQQSYSSKATAAKKLQQQSYSSKATAAKKLQQQSYSTYKMLLSNVYFEEERTKFYNLKKGNFRA